MKKLSAKVKRPLWVAGLNIALALTVGSTQAFAGNITSVAELLAVSGETSYVLTRNLDLADVTPSDSAAYITSTFTGTFDGGGLIISGLTKPLFDEIGGDESSEILNLTLIANESTGVSGRGILANETFIGTEIVDVHGVGDVDDGVNPNVGGLVGTLGTGELRQSSFTGDVTGTNTVGGLVGLAFGDITDSTFSGSVTGERYVGGIAGGTGAPTISNSSASGSVTGLAGGEGYIGGLVGGGSATITDSHADVTVTGATGNANIGGLLGYGDSSVTISNSYSTGYVNGADNVGGLVGYNNGGTITNSYATGAVTGDVKVGGLVGLNNGEDILNSYATGTVTGDSDVGGLVGGTAGDISNSYATGTVTGDLTVGGLVGALFSGAISNSYATGAVTGDGYVGGLVGENGGTIDDDSYATGAVNDVPPDVSPLSPTELLNILNTGSAPDSPIFALVSNLNSGLPYLISNPPPSEDNGDEQVSPRFNFSFLSTQVLDVLKKSIGFKAAKSDLSKLDLALLDQVKSDKSAQIIGGKLFSYQSPLTSLSVGSLLQLEINFEANKSLQMWVKSLDDQYVLVGDITFDKDGNALLPGIEFKKSGQYELIFVSSDKRDLTQPELVNKVSGLTVYVN